jgi:alkanesulfonate monooxygenase SsuD/methylene tetrahydromethanopterin reductase-like flavin-dependent oxidoreductase (luciferase family)
MKFMLFVPPTVPGTLDDRKRLRPIGRNNERYRQMLDDLRKLAVFADEAGFNVMSTTEHHCHSEGYRGSRLTKSYNKENDGKPKPPFS